MTTPPHTPLVLLAAIVGAGVAFFAWVYRDAPGARWLAAFMLAASVWSLAEGLALASPAREGTIRWTRVAWSVSGLAPLAWLATVMAHADHEWHLTPRRFAALAVEPTVFAALVWTNGRHGLVWTDLSTDLVGGAVVPVGQLADHRLEAGPGDAAADELPELHTGGTRRRPISRRLADDARERGLSRSFASFMPARRNSCPWTSRYPPNTG
jgi:hypothetical protein